MIIDGVEKCGRFGEVNDRIVLSGETDFYVEGF